MEADMSFVTILLIAVALGMDAFSMCIGIGMQGISTYRAGQLTLTVGVLHIVLPLAGIYLGQILGSVAGDIASYIGAAVLIFLGAKMIFEEFKPGGEEEMDRIGGWQYVVLPVSVSLDSLSIGFSLGTFGVQKMLLVTGVFGAVAAIMTLGGILLGLWVGHAFEKTSILGGGILVILGLKMLFL